MKRLMILSMGIDLAFAMTASAQGNRKGAAKGKSQQAGSAAFVDNDGDGICDNNVPGSASGQRARGRGKGAGNQGVGPRDGSGYGKGNGAGRVAGSGNCDGTGPKGQGNRKGRQ
jgi:hypothetical protein